MTTLLDRPQIRARIGDLLRGPGPSLVFLRGPSGIGKTTLLRGLLGDDPATVYFGAPPLPDPDRRELFGKALLAWSASEIVLPPDASWSDLLQAVLREVEGSRRRVVLAFDDAQRMMNGRSDMAAALSDLWREIRARSLPAHLLLAGTEVTLDPEGEGVASAESRVPPATIDLTLPPLDLGEVAARLPDYSAEDCLRAFAIFGGVPASLGHLDPSLSLSRNVASTFFTPEAPLSTFGEHTLERSFQNTARYLGILRALAVGARAWGEIVAHRSDMESGAQLAPYLAKLERAGLVSVDRSLDAALRSRRRRYRISDPALAFWHAAVLPHASEIAIGRGTRVWEEEVRPALAPHFASVFTAICRDYLVGPARKRLGGSAREVGGLWGEDYDLEVGATMLNGAIAYGRCVWGSAPVGEEVDVGLARQLRNTRYGYGREARMRLVFSATGFTAALKRRAARDPMLHLLGPSDLIGR